MTATFAVVYETNGKIVRVCTGSEEGVKLTLVQDGRSFLYVDNKNNTRAIKKKKDLKKRSSQTPACSNCLIINPPQLKQKPPNNKSK